MRFETRLSPEECLGRLRDGMESHFLFGEPRYVGWVLGPFFHLQVPQRA